MIYLDNAATTIDKSFMFCPVVDGHSVWDGNPHSIHRYGIEAKKVIEEAEKTFKEFINGWDGQFFWTGSGSQANSLAIRTVCESHTLVTTAIEHKSILQHIDTYVRSNLIPPNQQGQIQPFPIPDWTDMVSVQFINNETGIINPIKAISDSLDRDKTYFHTDAVQAFGKIPIDVDKLGIDLMTFSSHKCHGPKGLGGLWVRNRVLKDKTRGRFKYLGTPPVELIDRLASVVENIDTLKHQRYVIEIENMFLSTLMGQRTKHLFTLSPKYRISGLISLHIPGVDSTDLVFELSEQGVYISSGSACDNGKVGPSHVLTAMGISKKQAEETIRVSFSHLNTIREVQTAAQIMASTIERIRNGPKSP